VPACDKIVNGRTTVPLHLDPWETVFVVFRHPAKAPARTLPVVVEKSIATIAGPWQLSFQPDRGAPPQITLERLVPWQESADEGVRYFGGTGTYAKTVQADSDWFKPGAELWIDLGEGQDLGAVWV